PNCQIAATRAWPTVSRYFSDVVCLQFSVLPPPQVIPCQPMGREGVRGAHWIVLEDTVVRQGVLPEYRQRAIARRAEADITVAVVPLAGSARIGPRGLLVLGSAGVGLGRSRATGGAEGIRIEAAVPGNAPRGISADRLGPLDADE